MLTEDERRILETLRHLPAEELEKLTPEAKRIIAGLETEARIEARDIALRARRESAARMPMRVP